MVSHRDVELLAKVRARGADAVRHRSIEHMFVRSLD